MDKKNLLRNLPKVDDVLNTAPVMDLTYKFPNQIVTNAVRETIDQFRKEILSDQNPDLSDQNIIKQVTMKCEKIFECSLQKTINATGVILHTNMGRSLLSKNAIGRLVDAASNYTNLEYDVEEGKRGSRYVHAVKLLKEITKAEDAVVVNNNAGAVFLALNTLGYGKETIISRGELVEVGGSFRISSIMEKSGSHLVEVGATNKTHIYDYENAISENTALIMKVHTSNFRVVGFHEEVHVSDLKKIAGDIPIIEDLGSGSLADLSKYGLSYERTVGDCIEEGVDLVMFSGDKILGGPQAGILVGKKRYIDQIKKNQLLRAFRVDKFTLAALEETLRAYLYGEKVFEEIPTLHMITESYESLCRRAEILQNIILKKADIKITLEDGFSEVGGGAYPTDQLRSRVLVFHVDKVSAFERYLRLSEHHIIGKIQHDKYMMDIRTIFEKDYEKIAETVKKYGVE